MKIYTSRYGNKEIAQTDLIPVGISAGNPRFKTAFKIEARLKQLAPTREMLKMEYEPYKKLYFSMLDALDMDELQESFNALRNQKSEIINEKDLVLLCFEDITKKGEWCHRRMFAEWWQKKTGNKVEELKPLASQKRQGA